MTKKRLGFAFLGCGKIAKRHAKIIRKLDPEAALYFASRTAERAETFCRELGGAGSFSSYAAALADPRVDVAAVVMPPVDHLAWTEAALESGKHVVVEKPVFLRYADFAHVRAIADRVGRQVLVAENYFYKPLRRRIANLLAADAIGEPLCLYVNALKKQKVKDWRGDPSISGGGALFEGGVHWVHFLNNLGLTAERVDGVFPGQPERGHDRSAVVRFDYAEGVTGTLFYSWEVPSLLQGLRASRIYGRRGSIFFETNGLVGAVYGRQKRLFFPGFRDIHGYQGMWRDFLGALAEDREPELTYEIASRDYKQIESIYDSNFETNLLGEQSCNG